MSIILLINGCILKTNPAFGIIISLRVKYINLSGD